MLKVILGPPGTGKTSKLIEVCKDAIQQGVEATKIGFMSFTRQATEQAIQRAGSFSERGLPYFRTIHSLAFREMGYRSSQVFGNGHLAEFAQLYGFEFTNSSYAGDDGLFIGRTEDDKVRHLIGLSRVKGEELEKTYNEVQKLIPLDVELGYVQNMNRTYETFKKANSLYDFTDMLVQFAFHEPNYPSLDLLCVDEAQDLSAIQWLIVNRLIARAKETVVVGDDDQAIYEWSGADVRTFQTLAEWHPTTVLDHTYRFGGAIFAEGHKVISRCKQRISKTWTSAPKDSIVSRETGWDFLSSHEGSVLILARNSYLLEEVVGYLEDFDIKWDYINNKKSKAEVKIGTIHSAKGAEADEVVLISDVSRTTYENIDSDAEARVWYVGVTRAKTWLHIMEPQSQYYYEL